MRKSIIAGLTLSVALGSFAGPAPAAQDNDSAPPPVSRAQGHKQVRQIAETPGNQFRIPANPVVRDCVHVMFPQCSRGYDGLNDGSYNRRY
jgi:hypothetical protein